MMPYFDCGYGYSGVGWIGGIFMIIFWIMIIALFITLLRRMFWTAGRMPRRGRGNSYERHEGDSEALDILKERYARGEIDKAEFEEKKKDLEG